MENGRLTKPGETRIIDVDVHVDDRPQYIAPYCAMPWRKSLEILGTTPQRYLDIPGFAPSFGAYPPLPGGHKRRSSGSPQEMRTELDQLGISDAILVPDHLLLFAVLPTIDYATALAEAYNRWLVAEWLGRHPGLWGALIACPQNPEASAKEILRYAGTPNVKAVYLPTAGVNPLWGARKYDPILSACAEAGFPVILHSVSLTHPAFPANVDQFENSWARQIIGHTFSMMANMVSLMHTGVPVRYPNLKIVFTESGVAWVPGMVWRMDRYWNEYRRQVPFLVDRPSDYVKRQMWFATQPYEEPDAPRDLVETMMHYCGEDRTVFASDWPHHDFDHPSALLKLPLTPLQRDKLLWRNAVDLFKLPAMADAPAAE